MKKKTNKSPKLRDFTCVICEKSFQKHISPSAIKSGRGKVCSKECKNKLNSIQKTKPRIKIICNYCGKEFESRISEVERSKKRNSTVRFCSRNCNIKFKKENKEPFKTSQKRIKSLKKVKHTEEWNKKVALTKIGDKNPAWNNGSSLEPYSVDWTETLKRSIRERDHYTCRLCGKEQGDKALSVHHIDYDKKNCNPDNLITLCDSCHQKTNFNREYWKQFFKEF